MPHGLSLGHRLGAVFTLQLPATALALAPVNCLAGDQCASSTAAGGSGHGKGISFARQGLGLGSRWRVALPWCLGGAGCFCAAVAGQVVALEHLPESVAMPLTQVNVAVAACWGLLLFGEVESLVLQRVFAAAVAVDLVGATLLALA